jgi:hypothetical protein
MALGCGKNAQDVWYVPKLPIILAISCKVLIPFAGRVVRVAPNELVFISPRATLGAHFGKL